MIFNRNKKNKEQLKLKEKLEDHLLEVIGQYETLTGLSVFDVKYTKTETHSTLKTAIGVL